jgi:hypothetical protein
LKTITGRLAAGVGDVLGKLGLHAGGGGVDRGREWMFPSRHHFEISD